jgi:hypothetical protein
MILCGAVATGLALGVCAARPAVAEDAVQPPPAAAPEAPGMRIHRDPATGRPLDAPAPGTAAPVPQPRGALPAEEPGRSAAGGIKLDVRSHLRESVTSEANADGTTTTRYVPQAAGREE